MQKQNRDLAIGCKNLQNVVLKLHNNFADLKMKKRQKTKEKTAMTWPGKYTLESRLREGFNELNRRQMQPKVSIT